jgi:fatty acid desaturase
MEECMAEFQTWYNHVHHGRKLHWLHHLSKGDLRMNYLKRKYEVQVRCELSLLLLCSFAPFVSSLLLFFFFFFFLELLQERDFCVSYSSFLP